MKKLLYSLAAFAIVATTACQESELTPGVVAGDYATLTINAKALSSVESKAALADYSDEALMFYLEVYKEGELYLDLGSSEDGQFSTRLITGQEYTLVAWADHNKGYYNTEDLTNVTIVGVATDYYPAINTTDRDAFAGTETVTITDNSTITFEITRPFARINVKTNDIADIPEGSGLRPTGVQLVYTGALYTVYNVLAGEVADDGVIDLTTAVTAVIDEEGELSADYVFAPTEGGVAEFTAYYTADGAEVTSYTFSNIPYKRNYQTNISGNLLTKQGDITVTVDPTWEGEEDVNVSGSVSVATVEEANEFFETFVGSDNVNISIGVVDGTETIEVPSTVTSNVTFVIETAINEPVLIVNTEISSDLTIDNQSGTAMGLEVTAENASVYVKGDYNSVSVASAPATAYIAEGAEVETLTVNKGNVVLYGTVGSIVRGSDNEETVELTAYGTLGTIDENIDLIDGTILYNVTTCTQYANLTSLVAYGNISDDDVLFVGAGVHTTASGLFTPQDRVTIYGPNRGVAATSTERKAEAQIAATLYRPAGSSITPIDVTIDGVEFVDNAGFFFEGGSNVVVKNTIISSNGINTGSESNRILYTNGTYHPSVITLEDNIFKAADGSALTMRIIGERHLTNGNTQTELVMNNNIFENYNFTVGAYLYDEGNESNFTITNNTFTNTADTEIVLDLYDGSGLADAYTHFTVSGNTFNLGQVGINVGFIPESYDPFATSAIESANTFNGLDVNVEIPITFFNITTVTKYDTFTELMAGVVAGDEVFLGAGEYTYNISANWKKNVTIYGANKGVAGNSVNRSAETIISPSNSSYGVVYVTASGAASGYCATTFDGVKFAGTSGSSNPYFHIEGGDELTIKNSVIAVAVPSSGTHSGRVIYSQASKRNNNLTLENNYFCPVDNQQQRVVLNNGTSGLSNQGSFTGNVFDYTHINAAVYQDDSQFTITGNEFNYSSPQAIATNSTYSKYTISGNAFYSLDLALKSYWGDLSEDQQTAFEADNTFEDVVTVYEKYQ